MRNEPADATAGSAVPRVGRFAWDTFDHRVWPFALTLAIVSALNGWRPREYAWFAVDHLSYLPLPAQILWLIVAQGLLLLAACRPLTRRGGAVARATVAALLLVSLAVFRTTHPSVHGDGESGGYPPLHEITSIRSYPNCSGRLHSFVSSGLRALPGVDRLRFAYHFPNPMYEDRASQDPSILATLVAGAVAIAMVTIWVGRRRLAPAAALGIQLLLLTAPAMLGAYGHFDSYIVPSVALIAWWFAMIGRRDGARCRRTPLWVAVTLVLAAWAHPLLLILLPFSLLAGAWPWIEPMLARLPAAVATLRHTARRPPLWLAIALGLLAGVLPYWILMAPPDWMNPNVYRFCSGVLHERILSVVQACLPAFVLGLIACCAAPRRLAHMRPPLAWVALLGAFTTGLLLALRLLYGLRDEFLYAMLGLPVLFGAIGVAAAAPAAARLLLYAGIVSAALFLPRLSLNAGDALLDRAESHWPHDPCLMHRDMSPYWLAAACQPLDTADGHARRLRILESGIRSPLPMWSDDTYRARATAVYAAWCCAFGETARARNALDALAHVNPWLLKETWRTPGIFKTERYNPRAPWVARELSRDVLATIRRQPDATNVCPELASLEATLEAYPPHEPPPPAP